MKQLLALICLLSSLNSVAINNTQAQCSPDTIAGLMAKIQLTRSLGIDVSYVNDADNKSTLSSLQKYSVSEEEAKMLLQQLGIRDEKIKIGHVYGDNDGQILAFSKTADCKIKILPAVEITQDKTNVIWDVTDIKKIEKFYHLDLMEVNTNQKIKMSIRMN